MYWGTLEDAIAIYLPISTDNKFRSSFSNLYQALKSWPRKPAPTQLIIRKTSCNWFRFALQLFFPCSCPLNIFFFTRCLSTIFIYKSGLRISETNLIVLWLNEIEWTFYSFCLPSFQIVCSSLSKQRKLLPKLMGLEREGDL